MSDLRIKTSLAFFDIRSSILLFGLYLSDTLWKFSLRIFRVALLFICQGSVLRICCFSNTQRWYIIIPEAHSQYLFEKISNYFFRPILFRAVDFYFITVFCLLSIFQIQKFAVLPAVNFFTKSKSCFNLCIPHIPLSASCSSRQVFEILRTPQSAVHTFS